MLIVFSVSIIFELISIMLPAGYQRKITASLAIISLSFSSGGIALYHANLFSALIFILSIYRGVNILRLVAGRVSEQQLRRVALQTSLWLIGPQLFLLAFWQLSIHHSFDNADWVTGFAVVQLVFAMAVLMLTFFHLHEFKFVLKPKRVDSTKLPTVTVAIPARNEDTQLETCLRSVLASDYPKLEVVVLDDCSQDKTSLIIREFAHDGVRFVKGDEPKTNWLAKNQAYEQLFKESSGDIILFCGVDVQFGPKTIQTLVTSMIQKRKNMMSVMPINGQSGFSLPQAFRYIWELVPPRSLIKRPPVLSTCWLIKSEVLRGLGGFSGVTNMITPEAFFAQKISLQGSYMFIYGNEQLGVTSSKLFRDQFDTSVRVRYPQTHRRPEFVALSSMVELIFLVLPFSLAVAGIFVFGNNILVLILYLVTCVLLLSLYSTIGFQMFPKSHWRFMYAFPFSALFDVAILNYSMCKYEFSTVDWKGRNVCFPVMQSIPRLPKI